MHDETLYLIVSKATKHLETMRISSCAEEKDINTFDKLVPNLKQK